MNYHLNRQGHHMGVFPLEELHRRRMAGELTGSEIVWCEGMVQWQSLDVVLREKLPGALRPPRLPQAKSKTSRVLLVVVGVMLLFFVSGLVFLGIAIAKYAPRLNRTLTVISQGGTPRPDDAASGASAQSIASQPVAWASNAVTAAEVQVRNREFRLRQYVDGYKLRGERDTDADDLSLGLVQNWVAANYGGTYDTNLPSLTELSDKLAADPDCTDPLILTVTAANSEELHEGIHRLERAVNGFEHSKHLGYPKFFATVTLATKLIDLGTSQQRVTELDALALQRLREALADGSLQPKDQEEVGEILLLNWGRAFFLRNQVAVYSMVQDQGKTFQWLALVLRGEYEINEAWRMRGGGYVNTVTESGAEGFSKHLDLAGTYLTQAWQLEPTFALAPCRMIYVSLGNAGLAEMRLWFDRTLAAQVDFDKAWSDLRWGLRPRWYGDADAMLALGVTALNTRHFETDVPRKFYDSLTDLEQEANLPAGEHLYGRDDIWPHLQEMYEGYIAEPAQAGTRDGWRGTYASVAYLAGKYEVAGRQLQAIDWQPGAWSLTGWGVDLTLMPLAVAARTGAQGAAVTAAEASRDQGDISSALKQYRDLSAMTGLDDRTRSFVRERLASLGTESRLQNHEWVDYLPTDTNFTGWHIERGNCKLNPDGSLEVVSGEGGHLLYSRTRLGREFEVRGQFEVQRTSTKAFQAGLVMGLPQFDGYNWYSFRMKRSYEGDVATFARHWSKPEIATPVPLNNFANTFDFRFQNGKVSATVNNQEVFQAVAPPNDISVSTNEFMLGLGAFNDSNDTVIEYRNVQARSLADQ